MPEITLNRRGLLIAATSAIAAPLIGVRVLRAADASPANDPLGAYKLAWTSKLRWGSVVDVTTMPGDDWDAKLAAAQATLTRQGGGVAYFPAGTYAFKDHVRIADGVILRGAEPKVVTRATEERYDPPTKLVFPKYEPLLEGDGAPIDAAFKGVYLANPAGGANTGVVNIAVDRGHIHLDEADGHACGANRVIFGCVLTNCAVADPAVPNPKYAQHAWQRFTSRHHAAIDAKSAENLLIANNRLPKSGDANFTQPGFILDAGKGKRETFDVVFDYDNRPGLYINHFCVGGEGGSGNDGTPETHPYGFRKGTVIRDNYVFNSGRMSIGFCGDGVDCSFNVTRIEPDVWRPTVTGYKKTSGAATNDNRAVEMRGWRWRLEGNDCVVHRNWAADRSYYINDGEGLMHEDHCNSDLRGAVLLNNRINSYISLYKCGVIDGLLIEGNDVSTPGKIADIYVMANRNTGEQPCRNVSIVNNVTRSNGIHIAGSPAANNVVRGNTHKSDKPGVIRNEANAKMSDNTNYA
ncbi:MAG: hypothetical protein GC159_18520 [Phycisphaera sp.]|nr:hypothetical protein [Phycisphaera sp.]